MRPIHGVGRPYRTAALGYTCSQQEHQRIIRSTSLSKPDQQVHQRVRRSTSLSKPDQQVYQRVKRSTSLSKPHFTNETRLQQAKPPL